MQDKAKRGLETKRGNPLKSDFSKNLNQLIEDQSSNFIFNKKKCQILFRVYQRK